MPIVSPGNRFARESKLCCAAAFTVWALLAAGSSMGCDPPRRMPTSFTVGPESVPPGFPPLGGSFNPVFTDSEFHVHGPNNGRAFGHRYRPIASWDKPEESTVVTTTRTTQRKVLTTTTTNSGSGGAVVETVELSEPEVVESTTVDQRQVRPTRD